MLLEVDGFDEPWDSVSVPRSVWDGEYSQLDDEDCPMALRRILSPEEIRNYDNSNSGVGGSLVEDDDHDDQLVHNDEDAGEVRRVRNLSLKYFRSKLVEHFNIKFNQNQVAWPARRGHTRPGRVADM